MAKNNTKTSKAGKNTPKAQNTVTETITPIAQEPVQAPETQEIEKPVEAPKVEKQLKKSLSDAELQERLALARTRKGEIVNFLCTKTQDWTIGLIRTARLDKRSGFIQFRIEVLDYPLPEENPADFKNPSGNWVNPDGTIECPVRRTNILWGKGDDSAELKVIGHYEALPKPLKSAPKEDSAKESSKDPEEAAMEAAMADMAAEGLM